MYIAFYPQKNYRPEVTIRSIEVT